MKGPLPFDDETRMSHTHVVGSTGSGKSTLLKQMIAHDLRRDPAVVVLEPHHSLIPELARLRLDRNVVLIDPRQAPGINIFDVERSDDREVRQRTFASVVRMLSFFIKETTLETSGKQANALKHICRLLLSLREARGTPATFRDLYDFLVNPEPYQCYIDQLPETARIFFQNFQARGSVYKSTAEELLYRVDPIVSDEVIGPIFTSPTTTFDMGRELDAGSLILVDADQSYLGDDHALFGKVVLELILQAARQRPAKDPDNRASFVYIDEAHRFLGEQARDLLTDVRKYGVGCILAHQNMQQEGLTPSMKGALAGCALKFAASDVSELADGMRTTTQFMQDLPPYHFAAHVRGMKSAASVRADEDPLADFDEMSDGEYARFRERNRERLMPTRLVEKSAPSPDSETDIADTW